MAQRGGLVPKQAYSFAGIRTHPKKTRNPSAFCGV
jgi:hypothetical protein